MELRKAFRGKPRDHKTRWTVRLADRLSRLVITISGIGTILAVSTVFVFLAWVVVPLFGPTSVTDEKQLAMPAEAGRPLLLEADEDQRMAWALTRAGVLTTFRLDDGTVLKHQKLFDKGTLTAVSLPLERKVQEGGKKSRFKEIAFGFADGSVSVGRFQFTANYLTLAETPPELRNLEEKKVARLGSGLVERLSDDLFRVHELEATVSPPARSPAPSPVRLIDFSATPRGSVICLLTEEGKLRLNTVKEKTNLLSGQVTRQLSGSELPFELSRSRGMPRHLLLSSFGDKVFLVWEDGGFLRYDARDPASARVVERGNFLGETGARLTGLNFLLGKSTFVIGDSDGGVSAWSQVNTTDAGTSDDILMVRQHRLAGPAGVPVTALVTSASSRVLGAGYGNGHVLLYGVTAEKRLADVTVQEGNPVTMLALAPKNDGLLAVKDGKLWHWKFESGYPEVTLAALFTRTWYEGYPHPEHVWQSSSGDDAFEEKFGMVPLVFGTLKASLYSLLFGVPLALLAAIYTSEFMRPRMKAVVKPTVEMMASLPSVVLGFLAGLVFAQLVEGVVPAVLCTFLTVPLAFLAGAQLWQLLPEKLALSLLRFRFLLLLGTLPFGLLGGALLGPVLERLLFAGDMRAWLDGGAGSPLGGWLLLFLPLSVVATLYLTGKLVNPVLRQLTAQMGRQGVALVDLAKFLGWCLFAILLALVPAWILTALEASPLGGILGPYNQRNALVVGFVMGFAIIPIVYTIAEDALSSVPESLRSGSLAAGATPWQTATRLIIPTAMSGLFSAVMIGMGRAIGETMIVVMATGNTPVMNWNLFSGFRTLSATIAVEMPEAVKGETHYRTLFLAALALFLMTFLLNTIAEVVRLRFRRRAYQL